MKDPRRKSLLKGANFIEETTRGQTQSAALNEIEAPIKTPSPTKEALQKGADLIKGALLNEEKRQQQGQVPVGHGKGHQR